MDAALSYRAAGVPSLEFLPGQASEVLDSSTVRLLAEEWKTEEEKEKELVELLCSQSVAAARLAQERARKLLKRKRKRRKKKAPKSSSSRTVRTWKPGHLSSSPWPVSACSVSASRLSEEYKNMDLPCSTRCFVSH